MKKRRACLHSYWNTNTHKKAHKSQTLGKETCEEDQHVILRVANVLDIKSKEKGTAMDQDCGNFGEQASTNTTARRSEVVRVCPNRRQDARLRQQSASLKEQSSAGLKMLEGCNMAIKPLT